MSLYHVRHALMSGLALGSVVEWWYTVTACAWHTKYIVFAGAQGPFVRTGWVGLHVVQCVQVSKAAYGVIIMAIFWATEVVPIPITSLLPVVIFPILGVMSTKELSQNYMKVSYARLFC